MAVTKIWTIKDSLQRVLDYAANPDKTEYDALAQTLHYAEKMRNFSYFFPLYKLCLEAEQAAAQPRRAWGK